MSEPRKPKTPILAVLTLALLVGHVWGIVSLLRGNSEGRTTSKQAEAATGHLVRLQGERIER